MKKKHRDITVDGVKYAWIARSNGYITIWKDKKIFYEDCSYNDYMSITPLIIKKAILIHCHNPKLRDVINMLTEIEYKTQEIKIFKEDIIDLKELLGSEPITEDEISDSNI